MFRALSRLTRSLAVAAGLLAFSPSGHAAEAGTLRVSPADAVPGAIVINWDGGVARPMADQIRNAFLEHQTRATRVIFRINSGGGSVAEGERVIEVLREIRKTHRLETLVERGHRCGSMCVFIYLQGEHRVAALSSLWLFHEVSHHDPHTREITRLDRPAFERLVNTYFEPAGVSRAWTERMKPMTVQSDYWQTGADLINDKSGIFHVALGNQRERLIAERDPTRTGPAPRVADRPAPLQPLPPPQADPVPSRAPPMAIAWETKACFELHAEKAIYVNVPCRN